MANLLLDIYSGDDPNGSILVTLDDSDVSAFEMRQGENELGAFSFKIRRDHPDATEANLAGGNYVKVRIPLIQAEPVAGYFLDEHQDEILSSDEEGGEYLTRKGPGSLFILHNAVLLDDFHVLTQHSRGSYDVPGYWTWRNEPYGAMLQRGLEEGRQQPGTPLADVTDDFNRQTDSDGLTWPIVAEEVQLRIGTDVLSLHRTVVESGEVFVRVSADLLVQAFMTRGEDLTGTVYGAGVVRFVKGENILTGLDREGRGTRAATHALVEGADQTYRQVVAPGFAGTGRWTTVNYAESNDTGLLDKVGGEELRKRNASQQAIELEFEAGDDPTTGRYLPFKHFKTGDLVSLDTGTGEYDFEDADFRVTGFRIVLGPASRDANDEESARSFRWIVELDGGSMGMGSGTSGGCDCPPGLRLCSDTSGITDAFERTEADGFGESDGAGPWTFDEVTFPGPASLSVSVDGDVGVVEVTDGIAYLYLTHLLPNAIDLTVQGSMLTPNGLGVGGLDWLMFVSDAGPAATEWIGVTLFSAGVAAGFRMNVRTPVDGNNAFDLATPLAGQDDDIAKDFKIRVYIDQAGGIARSKIWWADEAEPGTWDHDESGFTFTVPFEYVEFNPSSPSDPDADARYTIDNLNIVGVGATSSCIHGGPAANGGTSTKAAPGDHEHDYVAAGGTTGQVLAKASDADWDTEWVTDSGGVSLSDDTPLVESGSGDEGTSGEASRSDHVHPAGSGLTDHGALTGLGDFDHDQYLRGTDGGGDVLSTVAASGSTETLDLADGNVHDVTLTDDCTFTFAAVDATRARSFTLFLRQGVGFPHLATWPGSVEWAGGAPTLATGSGEVDVLTFVTLDGGTVWYGFATGGGSSVGALDDLTDVTLIAPAEDDTLRYVSGGWINDPRKFRPVTHDFGSGPELVWDGDDLVMEFF